MKKRVLHYLLLAAILLAAPAFFAWLAGDAEIWEGVCSFPPRTEDWGVHPEKLWNFRAPFQWAWFIGYAVFTIATMFPLARRAVRAAIGHSPLVTRHSPFALCHFPWWGWLGVGVIAVFWPISWSRIPALHDIQPMISYFPLWIGYILVMNALCVKRSGTSPLTAHPGAYLATFPVSSLFWWFFEYLNRYVWNWYYRGVSQMGTFEYTFYATICFASVLPAVTATAAWLHTFPAFKDEAFDGMARVDLRRPGWCAFLAGVALLGLSGIVFFPKYASPFLWLSPLMVFVLVQNLLGETSAFDRLRTGNWALMARFALAALICGFAWETWNYYALAKWVYAVPLVHRFQIWEMPLAGFAGYLPFGWECAAVTAWICPALVENEMTV